MLLRRIKLAEGNVENDKKLIADFKLELKQYIDTKDIFYRYIRRNREKDKNK